MPLFDNYVLQAPIAVAGMIADGAHNDSVSRELSVATTPGVFTSMSASSATGKLVAGVAGAGGAVGVLLTDETRKLPFPAGTVQTVLTKGRVYAVLASGATAPANKAAVSVNAAGEVVSTGGTVVPGAFGSNPGSVMASTMAGLCLVELNLPEA